MITTRVSSRLAGATCLFGIVCAVVALLVQGYMEAQPEPAPEPFTFSTLVDLTMSLNFLLVGGFVGVKRPGNLIGWAMMLAGVGLLAGGAVLQVYADLALFVEPDAGLPFGTAAAAITSGSWAPLMAGVFLIVLLFPSGRAPSPRWRLIGRAVVAGFAIVWLLITVAPGRLEPPYDEFENPLAFTDSQALVFLLAPIILFCLLSICGAVIDLIVRFRRSRGEEREQYKWLAFSAGLLVVAMPFSATAGFGILSGIANAAFGFGLLTLPLAIGIAVLRYHLYEIDRIVNRALVYALLTAVSVVTYFGLVVGLQELLRPLSGGSDLAIVVTTLTVAALFLPARQRVQSAVDRRFNRRQYDALRTVDAFGARLREQIELDALRYELLAVVDETMAPARTSLWLRTPEVRL